MGAMLIPEEWRLVYELEKVTFYETMGSHIKGSFIAVSINDNMDVMFHGEFIVKSLKRCL